MNTLNHALLENDPCTIAPPMTLNDDSALVQQSKMISSENAADPSLHCPPKIQLNRIVTSEKRYPNFNRTKKQRIRAKREKFFIENHNSYIYIYFFDTLLHINSTMFQDVRNNSSNFSIFYYKSKYIYIYTSRFLNLDQFSITEG